MSNRFGRKQKREMKETIDIEKARLISEKNEITRKAYFYKNFNFRLEQEIHQFKQQIANLLPKPQVEAFYITDIERQIETLEINIQPLRFRFVNPYLNEKSIEFIADQFAEGVKKEVISKLIKLTHKQL